MLLRQRFRAKTLEMGDQLLALGEEAPLREDARADTALHALDQGRVLAADLVVEGDQLVDPLLVDVPREEVVEEARRPLRAEREDRAAREVRAAREDVDAEVRPQEVELAVWDLAARQEGGGPVAELSELRRRQPVGL